MLGSVAEIADARICAVGGVAAHRADLAAVDVAEHPLEQVHVVAGLVGEHATIHGPRAAPRILVVIRLRPAPANAHGAEQPSPILIYAEGVARSVRGPRSTVMLYAVSGCSWSPRWSSPLTIAWDPVPEATSYCVAVWRISTGYQSGPYCLPGTPGERVATNRFTTTGLAPDLYTLSVVALTDVIVGSRLNRPLSFTVTAP